MTICWKCGYSIEMTAGEWEDDWGSPICLPYSFEDYHEPVQFSRWEK